MFDQAPEGFRINVNAGPEFHVPHEFAGTFQHPFGIGQFGSLKETDIDVICKDVDVTKGDLAGTRGRMIVVQQLANIVALCAKNMLKSGVKVASMSAM